MASAGDIYAKDLIEQRLAKGLVSHQGIRGSLTKCLFKLSQTSDDTDTVRSIITDVKLLQIELQKNILQRKRQEQEIQEYQQRCQQLESQVLQQQRTNKELRQQHAHASSGILAQQEYETLAKLTTTKHKTSRRELISIVQQVQTQINDCQRAYQQATRKSKIRQAQYQLFLSSLFDLQQSLQDDGDGNPSSHTQDRYLSLDVSGMPLLDNGEYEDSRHDDVDHDDDHSMPDAPAKSDNSCDDDEEEGELYDDL